MATQNMPQMFFARAAGRGQRPAQLVKRGETRKVVIEKYQEQIERLYQGGAA